MNTAQHRTAAYEARQRGDHEKAAHHYQQALAVYPCELLAQNSALVTADTANLAALAKQCAEIARNSRPATT